jgi:hypothetical protein
MMPDFAQAFFHAIFTRSSRRRGEQKERTEFFTLEAPH